ncbi:MAG: DUF4381 family protein [Akkermansiaceae bacterium]
MPEIEDIIETPETAPLLLAWQWLLLALICVLIIWAIIAYLKQQKTSTSKVSSLKDALDRLKKIQQASIENNQDSNQLTTELSFLTRQYLQGQFSNKSLFQTHQEFIADHQDLDKLPQSAREKLSTYLTALADHKYSPDQHLPTEKNKLIQLTESLLRGIDSTVPKNL